MSGTNDGALEARIHALEQQHLSMASDVQALKQSLDTNTIALGEFIELGKGLKFGLKFLGYVENVSVWIAKVAAASAIVWAAWKFLVKEALSNVIS